MKYNFDVLTDRRNSDSLKWDVAENELPMWVADMDFRTAPGIIEAVQKRASPRASVKDNTLRLNIVNPPYLIKMEGCANKAPGPNPAGTGTERARR